MKKISWLVILAFYVVLFYTTVEAKTDAQSFDFESNEKFEFNGIVYSIPTAFSTPEKDNDMFNATAYNGDSTEATITFGLKDLKANLSNDFKQTIIDNYSDTSNYTDLLYSDATIAGYDAFLLYAANVKTGIKFWIAIVFDQTNDNLQAVVLAEAESSKNAYESDFFKMLLTASKNENASGFSTASVDSDGVTPEFKEKMDSIKEFFDEYIEFLKKYSSASTDELLGMMTDYANFLTKYSECQDALDSIDEDSLSEADQKYYLDTMIEIDKQLLEISQYLLNQ